MREVNGGRFALILRGKGPGPKLVIGRPQTFVTRALETYQIQECMRGGTEKKNDTK